LDADDAVAVKRFFGELPAPIDHVLVAAYTRRSSYGPMLDSISEEVGQAVDRRVTQERVRQIPPFALCGCERRSGSRRAFEFCGSREREPCIDENALLRAGGFDDDCAGDGTSPAGGETRVSRLRRSPSCLRVRAGIRRSTSELPSDAAASRARQRRCV
jgi:hypothetical protein